MQHSPVEVTKLWCLVRLPAAEIIHGAFPVSKHSNFCRVEAQYVAERVVKLGLLLGIITMISLGIGTHALPRLFTPSPDILAAIAVIFPW